MYMYIYICMYVINRTNKYTCICIFRNIQILYMYGRAVGWLLRWAASTPHWPMTRAKCKKTWESACHVLTSINQVLSLYISNIIQGGAWPCMPCLDFHQPITYDAFSFLLQKAMHGAWYPKWEAEIQAVC